MKPRQEERSRLKMYFKKRVPGPRGGSVRFRSCSCPVIGVATQKVHGSEEDLFSFPSGGGHTEEVR